MSNMRTYLDVMDIVVTGPTYVIFKRHGYCSHMSNIRKYLDVTDIVVTGPTYVNI
jgi:hypothetical protein